ncbi:MAG: glycoside hydrolase family 9 protein, partial [Melioribacteraceae bacterium]
DAGDYVKFLNTTAFSTYMLMFSYEFDPVKFGFDDNKNGVPDLLDEAKIGLDWMLRCGYDKNWLVTQVQDLRDHDVGWRLPEDDKLGFDRPAFLGMGKNLIGIYSAAMALASRIWRDRLHNMEFSEKCLEYGEKYFSVRNRAADIDSSGTGQYLDDQYEGKLALGAIELYLTTMKPSYLSEAYTLADSAKSDYWWSWGNINALAHYRIAEFNPRFSEYIKNNLADFNKRKESNIFGKGTELSWGTNVTLLGITLQNILYKKLTNDSSYDSLSVFQRDYILGRNSWGVSFISNAGKNFTKNFHHQISAIKGKLPGGFAAGPAKREFVLNFNLNYDKPDMYAKFQTEDDYYRDDKNDYITNEPTITGNATAIFVFGNLSK